MIKYILAALLLAAPALAQTGNLSGGSVKETGSTTSRTLANQAGEIPNLENYGGVCDAQTASGATATASNTTYGSGFVAGDIGKAIQIYGAGAGGVAHATTIANVSAGAAILSVAPVVNASASTSNAYYAHRRVAGASANSYAPGDTVTVSGGTGTAAVFAVATTEVGALTVNAGGTTYSIGDILYLTASDGTQLGQVRVQVMTLSGSAVATVAIIDGGRFAANATEFTQNSNSGSLGSGATFTAPKYNVAELTLTTPGVYTAVPSNPVSTTSSGSGTGLTLDVAYNTGGRYAWGTDNTAAFDLAIANQVSAPAELRVPIRLPATGYPCGIAGTVEINNSFIGFDGQVGVGRSVDGSTDLAASASLMWLGAQDGSMVTFTAVAGGSNKSLFGNVLRGIVFYGNRVAGYGAQFLSANTFKIEDIGIQDVTIAGLNVDVISGSLANEKCSQSWDMTRITSQMYNTAGSVIRTGGNSTCNASYGTITNVQANYRHGTAILFQDADHIWLKGMHAYRLTGGFGVGVEASCDAAGTHTTSAMFFDGLTPSDGGVVLRGTEWCPLAVIAVSNKNYDKTNGSPLPILGVGVNHTLEIETGDPSSVVSHGQVYFSSAGVTSTITQNTGGSTTASGSYTVVLTGVGGFQPGVVFNGTANITDGTVVTAVDSGTLTITLSHPTTGSIAGGSAMKVYAGAKLCPEGGGGLLINGAMMQVPTACVYGPPKSVAGPQPPNSGIRYAYAGYQWARVTGAASSDATRNLVRLTLSHTTGFQTGNQITCYGITGTTEANSTSYVSSVGNINDSTTIDLQGSTFANAYTGGGWCSWLTLNYAARGHQSSQQLRAYVPAGVQAQVGNPAWTLVGGLSLNTDSGNTFISQNANTVNTAVVASWFNRKPIKCVATSGTNRTATTTSFAELSSDYRCYFWSWLNSFPSNSLSPASTEAKMYHVTGMVANDTALSGCATAIGFDGTTAETGQSAGIAGTVSLPVAVSGAKAALTTEGVHYATILGKTITSGICTYNKDYTAIQITSWQ